MLLHRVPVGCSQATRLLHSSNAGVGPVLRTGRSGLVVDLAARSDEPHTLSSYPVYTCGDWIILYCTAPLLRPPLFATYFQEKEGGGRNNKDLRFCLAVKPPPLPQIHVLRSTKLCCSVEDENSFDRHAVAVLKDGRVVGHVYFT